MSSVVAPSHRGTPTRTLVELVGWLSAPMWVSPSYFTMSSLTRILLAFAFVALWVMGHLVVPDSWEIAYTIAQFCCTFPVIFWALWGHWPSWKRLRNR